MSPPCLRFMISHTMYCVSGRCEVAHGKCLESGIHYQFFSIFPARHAIPFHVCKRLPQCNNYGGKNQEMALQVLECLGSSVKLKYESKCDSRHQLYQNSKQSFFFLKMLRLQHSKVFLALARHAFSSCVFFFHLPFYFQAV